MTTLLPKNCKIFYTNFYPYTRLILSFSKEFSKPPLPNIPERIVVASEEL